MNAYVKLYCKKSKVKSTGLAPIYFVIKLNGKEKLLSTRRDGWEVLGLVAIIVIILFDITEHS